MVELQAFRVFADVKPDSLEKLEGMIRRIDYGADELIYMEGAPAFGFYLVFSGAVKVVKRSAKGKSQILKIIGPGGLLGETTLFDKAVHNAYAKTLGASTVGFIERGDFFYFLERHPKVAFRFYECLSVEIKSFQNKLAERSYASSKERLARLILALGRSGVELSRGELAEMAGVSSKTAIRTLGELEARGIVSIDNRKLTVLKEDYLQRLMEPFPASLDEAVII
ncbi:MAG: Crp/Fnr family transcriptional regulator [Candidatus Bipolaricaulota bacterium]